ncbi:hypothetical protein E4P40_11165 [Blastococcus sp. CT_GayMR20]|uniref:hypothetical protein n=1 Tax=Blastococcus sp. CT_GayMR20 TaxID=2559609 RepID=UPI001073FEE9|nr:hypothetical protein [Blastococcus sp. CT_GayMR20]TFV87721.1 hypothetical protein E4P40_11165 [Blastococcus sp. CT_GayMR20]
MSTADEPRPPRPDPADRPARPTRSPKQMRALIVGTIVGGIVLVFAFMLIVSQCGTGADGEIYGAGQAAVSAV